MSDNPSVPIDEKLLHATVKLNTLLFAAVCGVMGGVSLFLLTYISLYHRGLPNPGHYLNLLGFFLPGYNVSVEGAWLGLLWGGLIGALSGAVVYRVYARSIRQQVADYFASKKSEYDLEYAVLSLHGHSLGLALGGIVTLGLLVSTNWLVFRGTAEQSEHAALFSHFLPGYSVSFVGSLMGAIDIFILVYAFCVLLAIVYNGVSAFRHKGAAS
ncbi:MAG: hypothetical protein ACYC4K_09610 [Thiobacillus sp.]